MSTDTIELSPSTVLDLIWDTQRYAIGGKTGHSTGMAEDIWRIIRHNRDKFGEERLLFLARDIRANISDCLRWWNNVKVKNAYNDCIEYDAYSLLVEYLESNPNIDFMKSFFTIDCVNGEVTSCSFDCAREYTYPASHLHDWIKLANCIDSQYRITLECDGEKEERSCIKAPSLVYDKYGIYQCRDEMRWKSADSFSWGICEQYITKIEKI